MVKPEGASHWREASCVREVAHFRVSVWPSSTVMVSMVSEAAEEGEMGKVRQHACVHRCGGQRTAPITQLAPLPSESHDGTKVVKPGSKCPGRKSPCSAPKERSVAHFTDE